MAQRPLTLNIANFVSPTTGKPVSLGTVYIGEKDLDPTILGNRKTVVVVEETGVETTILPAAQPLTLSAGGVIQYNGGPVVVLIDGVYSIKVLDSLSAQQYYVPRANEFLEETIDTGLFVKNGSFENTTVDATLPDDWDVVETTTGTIEIDDTVFNHGGKSLRFTSVDASGAGSASSATFNVSPNQVLSVGFDLISTAVDTRTLVTITWLGASQTPVGTSTIIDESSANPVSWDRIERTIQAPANAFYGILVLRGMVGTGATVAGSTRFDNVRILDIDNAAFHLVDVTDSVNRLDFLPAATGVNITDGPVIEASGPDTDIGILIRGKGQGFARTQHRGALIYRSAAGTFDVLGGTTLTGYPYDTALYDNCGVWNPADPTAFNIPAGVSYCRLTAFITASALGSTTGSWELYITDIPGQVRTRTRVPLSEWNGAAHIGLTSPTLTLTSPAIPCAPGERMQVWVDNTSTAFIRFTGGSIQNGYFAIELLE